MKKTLAVLAVGTVLPLFAHTGIRYGAQLSTVTPIGHFAHSESKQGIGIGGFANYCIDDSHIIIARLDINRLGSRDGKDVSTINLGANYKMQINQIDGAYGLVGADVERARAREIVGKGDAAVREHSYNNKIGYTVGAGYDLNKNLGVQVRYNIHSYNKESRGAASLGVTCTF